MPFFSLILELCQILDWDLGDSLRRKEKDWIDLATSMVKIFYKTYLVEQFFYSRMKVFFFFDRTFAKKFKFRKSTIRKTLSSILTHVQIIYDDKKSLSTTIKFRHMGQKFVRDSWKADTKSLRYCKQNKRTIQHSQLL